MPFHYPARSRERILLMGGMGSGKTTAYLKTAKLHRSTRSTAKFYVLDTDDTVARFLETEYPMLLDTVEFEVVRQWTALDKQTDTYLGRMQPHDFLVCDMMARPWDMVQNEFIRIVMGNDPGAFYLQERVNNTQGNPLDGWKDWSVINRMYKTWTDKVFSTPGHLIACTGADPIRGDGDTELKAVFGPYGMKPQGQKNLGHEFHSVLWMKSARVGDWAITTIKDRGRGYWQGQQVNDFAMDYLRGTAGWSLT